MAGWAIVRAESDRVTLEAELAVEAAMGVTGVPMGSRPAPSNLEGLIQQLETEIKSGNVYRLTADAAAGAWSPQSLLVERREDDGIGIVITYRNAATTEPLTIDAPFIDRMPSEYRSAFTVLNREGQVHDSSVLRPGKTTVQMTLPNAVNLESAPRPRTEEKSASTLPASPVEPVSRLEIARRYAVLGVEHILIGYDHLLFLLALLVASRKIRTMLVIVTCFTLGHTVTLALAALDVVTLPPRIVEPLIAASIVYVGLENLLRNGEPRARWLLTLLFGLVHGFGFAGVLREIGFGTGSSIAVPLLAFNLGVELGQLAVVALVFPLLLILRRRPALARVEVPVASACVVVMGLYWLVQRLSTA
jgi:hydrogenase/urease accessory protein HupE